MSLSVLVKSASGLPNVERFSKSDPITVCTLQGKEKQTKFIADNLDPVWDETLQWECPAGLKNTEVLKVQVFDHEKMGKNKLLGYTDLQLHEAVSKGKQTVNTTLTGKKGDQLKEMDLILTEGRNRSSSRST